MKTVLVTGASGFLGRHVVDELAALGEFHVVAVISGRRHVDFPSNVSVEAIDLLQEKNCQELMKRVRPDICCHFAWALDDESFIHSEKNLQWLEASLHVLREFAVCGGKRFLFAGSSSEYGQTLSGCSETGSIGVEYSLYGMTKLAFEKTAEVYCRQMQCSFVSARYFSIYGSGDVRRWTCVAGSHPNDDGGENFHLQRTG